MDDKNRENGLEIVNIYDRNLLVRKRIVYLMSMITDVDGNESGIDAALFSYVSQALDILESLNSNDIRFVMNLKGGSWSDALAIYDRIMSCPCQTLIEAYGSVGSGAPIILQSADRRLIAPHATMLIHDGTVKIEGEESTRDAEAWGSFSRQVERRRMYEILASRSKLSPDEVKNMCINDCYITPKKALRLGLVDEILDPKKSSNLEFPRFRSLEKKVSKRKETSKDTD